MRPPSPPKSFVGEVSETRKKTIISLCHSKEQNSASCKSAMRTADGEIRTLLLMFSNRTRTDRARDQGRSGATNADRQASASNEAGQPPPQRFARRLRPSVVVPSGSSKESTTRHDEMWKEALKTAPNGPMVQCERPAFVDQMDLTFAAINIS